MPAPLEMLQDLPPLPTATSERHCSCVGLVWMVPYGSPSASQMLLPFFSNCTQTLDSLLLGEQTESSPRLVYLPLLLFTFCLPSGNLTCYFSSLALERKSNLSLSYLSRSSSLVLRPVAYIASFYFFLRLSPSLLCCSLSHFINLIILVILEHSLPSN